MAGFKNIGKAEYIQRYGWKYGIKRALFLMNPVHIVTDYENKKIFYYKKTEKYLKKNYEKYQEVEPVGLKYGEHNLKNPIWIYWKQGMESAPVLVKKCFESVKRYAVGEVILLSDSNISEYLTLPQNIIDLNKVGHISNAALSDLIRFSLLEHYGGTWIDSTVLLTGPIPQYITNSDFFVYQDSFGLIENPAKLTSWLIHCKKNHPILRKARNMSFAYWEHEEYVIEYLLPYEILEIALKSSEGDIGNFPYANSDYCHIMFNEIGNTYDAMKYTHITSLSSVHKLSYKLQESVYFDEDNLYHHIVTKSAESVEESR